MRFPKTLALIALLVGLSVEVGGQCNSLLLGAGKCGAAAASPLLTNLIVSYDLSDVSGNAVDSHTNGYNATETVGTIASAAGPSTAADTARDIEDADTEYFVRADNADLSMGNIDFTVALWVKLERNDVNLYALAKSDNNNIQEYEVRYNNGGFMQFCLSSATGFTNYTCVSSDAASSTAAWYFIVARHDATADTIDIGIDGDTTPTSAAYSAGGWDGGASLFLGQSGNNTVYWDGLLAQARIWKRLLTTSEVTWLYNSGNGRSYADIVTCSGC